MIQIYDLNFFRTNEWNDITESQFRLNHLKNGLNLIDLVNGPDYKKSFFKADKRSLVEDFKDNSLIVWLLRDCSRHPHTKECTSDAIDRRNEEELKGAHERIRIPLLSMI